MEKIRDIILRGVINLLSIGYIYILIIVILLFTGIHGMRS